MNLKKFLMPAALIGLAMTSMVACGGGSHSDTYYNGWYDVYGNRCGSLGPGCNYYSNGSKIVDTADPYYNSSYTLSYATYNYTDTYGNPASFTGWAWLSPTNVLYDSYGNALNESKSSGRNVVGDAAAKEMVVINGASASLSTTYGLSQEAAGNVAKLLNAWAVIGKDHARTDDDTADFTKRLYGIDVNSVKVALNQAKDGDTSALKSAAVDVADRWGTTPEMVIEMQKNWFAPQLKAYGVR